MHEKICNTFPSFDKQNTFLWQNIWHIFEALICRTPYPYTVMNGAMYARFCCWKVLLSTMQLKIISPLEIISMFQTRDHSAHMGCCCIMELNCATFGNRVLISTWQSTKQLVTPLWGSPLEEATCMGRLIYNKVLMASLYPLGDDEKYKWPIILFSLVRYLTHCCILSSLGSGMYQSFGLESDLQTSPDIGSKTDSGWYNGDICLVLKLI